MDWNIEELEIDAVIDDAEFYVDEDNDEDSAL